MDNLSIVSDLMQLKYRYSLSVDDLMKVLEVIVKTRVTTWDVEQIMPKKPYNKYEYTHYSKGLQSLGFKTDYIAKVLGISVPMVQFYIRREPLHPFVNKYLDALHDDGLKKIFFKFDLNTQEPDNS